MPDPILFLKAGVIAGLIAGVIVLLSGLRSNPEKLSRLRFGYVLGTGLGFYVGAWVLGMVPQWPIPDRDHAQDMDRLLWVLIPGVIVAELVAALPWKVRHGAWALRAVVAVFAARVLLDQSIYIADRAGPNSREWSPDLTLQIFGGLAIALGVVWSALGGLARWSHGWSVPAVLSVATGGAGTAIILSGYASGGQLGVPLSGALAGAALATLILRPNVPPTGAVSIGVVGLFALLIVGRFYGSLTTVNAAFLFFGTLLCIVPELPLRLRGVTRIAWASAVVGIVLVLAGQKFIQDSAPPKDETKEVPTSGTEPTIDDYLNFGK
jgi:hypothetical protein